MARAATLDEEYVSTYFWLHLKGDFQWFFMGEAKSHGWVGRGWLGRGSWVVGRGSWVMFV